MARRQSCEDALGELTAMANKTMVATGRWFRNPERYPNELKRHIPPAHEQFQRALDRLQQEIFLAKALLEIDYQAVCEKKAELNRAQRGEAAAPVALPPALPDTSEATATAPLSSTAPPAAQLVTAPAVNGPLQSTAQSAPTPALAPTTQPADTQAQAQATAPAQPAALPTITSTIPTTSSPSLATALVQSASSTTTTQPAQPPTVATVGIPDTTISGTPINVQAITAEPMVHTQSGISHASGSIGSLLPGLETYANAGDEAIMDLLPSTGQPNGQVNGQTSVPQTSQSNVQNQNNTTAENPRRDVVMDDVPESNFDDLFVGSGDFGGDADDLMMNTAETTDLDDSWFQ
ncbi:hypothetical protein MGYG_03338 [Nannizzia gypsea CBS 118893]|uniref:Uncharacterized protein n=1 Tax=Arthroderma gypseum (strain ATCC MYA-4604 / CBS 118893) TaxID=535722 RepID=E4UN34_ARTGP|nr:hypothetical protein MGYG_03338 [Nannizzia gypsea CBS 118893]EFR00336.1 hypothetical protein MGYG_03338 [Nannizzia gypsea CBS 118893]